MAGIGDDSNARHWFDQLSTAILVFNGRRRLDALNAAGETLLSLSRRQVVGQSALEIWRQSPDFLAALQHALASGNPYRERDFRLVLADGRSCQVDYMITPVCAEEGVAGLIVEMHRAAEPRTARDDASQLGAARSSLRGIAHEIRNPLGGIRGAAQLLERELPKSSLAEYTQIIIRETDRLRQFVDTLLVETQPATLQAANIHELLEHVVQLVMAESAGRAAIERDYDPSLPEVWVDREHMIRAVLNLMLNAWQGVGEGGGIRVRTRVAHQQTILYVQHRAVLSIEIVDDGPVIPEAIQRGMFYPLVTGRARGTGLGLPIAQQLLSVHGGIIEYERLEGGNCFRIRLPLRDGDGGEPAV